MNRCVLHFCLLLSASFVALAEREVSINLLHDLGDGFVSAGMIKGQLPDKVCLHRCPSTPTVINTGALAQACDHTLL